MITLVQLPGHGHLPSFHALNVPREGFTLTRRGRARQVRVLTPVGGPAESQMTQGRVRQAAT
jgi:hypothetical protein